jgi:hypothetical protein
MLAPESESASHQARIGHCIKITGIVPVSICSRPSGFKDLGDRRGAKYRWDRRMVCIIERFRAAHEIWHDSGRARGATGQMKRTSVSYEVESADFPGRKASCFPSRGFHEGKQSLIKGTSIADVSL